MNINNNAQTSNFKVYISFLGDKVIYANGVNLPGFTLTNIDSFPGSGKKHYVGGDSIQYSDVNVTFLLDENFVLYKEFVKYFNTKVHNNNGCLNDEEFEAVIEVTDNLGKSLIAFEMHNCRVMNFSDLELTMTNDDQEITFTLSFQFDWYELVDYLNPSKLFKLKNI